MTITGQFAQYFRIITISIAVVIAIASIYCFGVTGKYEGRILQKQMQKRTESCLESNCRLHVRSWMLEGCRYVQYLLEVTKLRGELR